MKTSAKKAPYQKRAPYKGRVLNARPDTIDFRDKIYVATLVEVPIRRTLEEYKAAKVPILDQGQEGACTGFGLATTIHYLLRKRAVVPSQDCVSPRMLYEMAKKYDEWEGEDYIGSSARGAMKGWHKHGVCLADDWQYDQHKPDKELTPQRAESAANIPLGAYYRVNHKDLVDMHTALAEVGILYATARVHDGWFMVDKATGEIPFSGQPIQGGHAFTLVAFDENGFWIQNSWGKTWGKEGFALITYDDWLANATDVWVARLGAVVSLRSANSIARSFSVAAATRNGISFKDLRPHVITLGNQGLLKTTGTYGNHPKDVERIFTEYIPELTKTWKKKRILLFANSGLDSESSVLQRLADYRQALLSNEIFPVFLLWHTDLWTTVKNLLEDALQQRKPEERLSPAFDFMLDRLDDALEPLARATGRQVWEDLKTKVQNAFVAASQDQKIKRSIPGGGAYLAATYLKEFMQQHPGVSIHVVGHSAGSIFLAGLVKLFTEELAQEIKSCTLWAPASTMEQFHDIYLPAIRSNKIERLALYTLTDQAEQDDNCQNIYNKSLLYLISNALEETPRGTSLLGMAKYINQEPALTQLIAQQRINWITSPNNQTIPDAAEARHHGGFDSDLQAVKSTLARILQADPALIFGDLVTTTEVMPPDAAEAGTRAGTVPKGGTSESELPVPPGPSPIMPQINLRPTQARFHDRRIMINQSLFQKE